MTENDTKKVGSEDQNSFDVTPVTSNSPLDTIKDRVGVSLDELFEGFQFVRKEGIHFVFSDGLHEMKFNLSSVKRALAQRVEEERNEELLGQLKTLGLYRVSFVLPSLSLTEEANCQGVIKALNSDHTHAILAIEGRGQREVHLSLLRDLQAERLIRELKDLETGFVLLTLGYSVKRIREITEQLFHSKNESSRTLEAKFTLSRLRALILERLVQKPEELRGLRYTQLLELRDEMEEGLAHLGTDGMGLISLYMTQLERLSARIELLSQSDHLHRINSEEFLDLFSPDELREELLEALIEQESISEFLCSSFDRCLQHAQKRADRVFQLVTPSMLDLPQFVEKLFDLQAHYLNTQLRIGRLDFSMIRRFKVLVTEEGDTLPILRDYEGITAEERLNLYQELVDHRLNLLFSHQIIDHKLREYAHDNVQAFYKIFYQLTHKS